MRFKTKRGQSGTELFITLAFSMVMLVPIIILAYLQAASGTEQLALQQAQQSVNKLKMMADVVDAHGEPAKVTIDLVVPQRTHSIIIGSRSPPYVGREIIFAISTGAGVSDVVATTDYNVSGDLSGYTRPGSYKVQLFSSSNCAGGGSCVQIAPA